VYPDDPYERRLELASPLGDLGDLGSDFFVGVEEGRQPLGIKGTRDGGDLAIQARSTGLRYAPETRGVSLRTDEWTPSATHRCLRERHRSHLPWQSGRKCEERLAYGRCLLDLYGLSLANSTGRAIFGRPFAVRSPSGMRGRANRRRDGRAEKCLVVTRHKRYSVLIKMPKTNLFRVSL